MNEQPYQLKHLREYTGILTSPDARGDTFTMEIKAEDNPIMERWTQKNGDTIELDFRYDIENSTMFFHNWRTCENRINGVECKECQRMSRNDHIFKKKLSHLQFGDTFKIRAALINNRQSELPAEIHDFKSFQPLLVACEGDSIRLPDTPEGIKKKYEREQQRLQRERDAEEKRKEDEEQAQRDAKWTKRKETLKQFFGKRQTINQIIGIVIATTIANQILPHVFKYIYRLFVSN